MRRRPLISLIKHILEDTLIQIFFFQSFSKDLMLHIFLLTNDISRLWGGGRG